MGWTGCGCPPEAPKAEPDSGAVDRVLKALGEIREEMWVPINSTSSTRGHLLTETRAKVLEALTGPEEDVLNMPIEEVRAELKARGIDTRPLQEHVELQLRLRRAERACDGWKARAEALVKRHNIMVEELTRIANLRGAKGVEAIDYEEGAETALTDIDTILVPPEPGETTPAPRSPDCCGACGALMGAIRTGDAMLRICEACGWKTWEWWGKEKAEVKDLRSDPLDIVDSRTPEQKATAGDDQQPRLCGHARCGHCGACVVPGESLRCEPVAERGETGAPLPSEEDVIDLLNDLALRHEDTALYDGQLDTVRAFVRRFQKGGDPVPESDPKRYTAEPQRDHPEATEGTGSPISSREGTGGPVQPAAGLYDEFDPKKHTVSSRDQILEPHDEILPGVFVVGSGAIEAAQRAESDAEEWPSDGKLTALWDWIFADDMREMDTAKLQGERNDRFRAWLASLPSSPELLAAREEAAAARAEVERLKQERDTCAKAVETTEQRIGAELHRAIDERDALAAKLDAMRTAAWSVLNAGGCAAIPAAKLRALLAEAEAERLKASPRCAAHEDEPNAEMTQVTNGWLCRWCSQGVHAQERVISKLEEQRDEAREEVQDYVEHLMNTAQQRDAIAAKLAQLRRMVSLYLSDEAKPTRAELVRLLADPKYGDEK